MVSRRARIRWRERDQVARKQGVPADTYGRFAPTEVQVAFAGGEQPAQVDTALAIRADRSLPRRFASLSVPAIRVTTDRGRLQALLSELNTLRAEARSIIEGSGVAQALRDRLDELKIRGRQIQLA